MCEDLLASLSKYVDTKGMNMQLLMKEGAIETLEHNLNLEAIPKVEVEETEVETVKLFGAFLKVSTQGMCMKNRKRMMGWSDQNAGDACSVGERPMKIAPWIARPTPFQPGSSKVSN